MISHELMVILNYVSAFVMLGCTVIIFTHEESRMQKLALMACMTLLICNFGFLVKVEADTIDKLIVGQKMIYASITHSMFLMLLFILNYCKYKIPKALEWTFHSLNLIVTFFVITLDHHHLFYRSYWAEDADGYLLLQKEYGPVHTLANALFILYMAAAVVAAVSFAVRNMNRRKNYVLRLLVAVLIPCITYFLPSIFGTDNELQPVSFSIYMVSIVVMIYKNNLYDVDNIAARYSLEALQDGIIVFGRNYDFKGCNRKASELFPFLENMTPDTDIRPVSSILQDFLDGKINEYESGGKIYGISIMPADSEKKSGGNVVWMSDVTLERNYTNLIKKQKQSLESEVVTLSDISRTDDMTGLGNRRAYEEALQKIRDEGSVSGVTVVAMDLNGLKTVNDSIGHQAGDELIRGAAGVIANVFSSYGETFRTGGDEFTAILKSPCVPPEEILAEFQREVSEWRGRTVPSMSISVGTAYGGDFPGIAVEGLVAKADRALYVNKNEYYETHNVQRRTF